MIRNGGRLLITCRMIALALVALATFSPAGADATVGGLTQAGSLATPRLSTWMVVLNSGKVLMPGGVTGQVADAAPTMTATAELYDPTAKTWSSAGSMAILRMPYFALLLSNGKVLAGGGVTGYDASNNAILTRAAELYDPTGNSWSTANAMSHEHAGSTPYIMGNGKVVIAGGVPSEDGHPAPTSITDIYNPATNSWTSTTMATARNLYTAIILQSGKLLIIGGRTGYDTLNSRDIYTTSCELFDPAAGTWSPAGSMSHPHGSSYDPQMFSDGRVLIAGGLGNDGNSTTSAEIYNPATNTWSSAGSMSSAHIGAMPILLSGDRVFFTGGADLSVTSYYGFPMTTTTPTGKAEIYTESTNSWTSAGTMTSPHFGRTAVKLGNGKIFIAGGADDGYMSSYTQGAELYNPATNSWSSAGTMTTTRASGGITVPLPDGNAMVFGGFTDVQTFATTAAVDLYDATTNGWSVSHLSEPKGMAPWALLNDQTLLFAGGYHMGTDGSVIASATADVYAGAGSVAPTVTSTSPAAKATGVSVSTTIKAVFSEALNEATITTSTFSLDHGVAGTVSYDSATYTATFTPKSPLAYDTNYTATITTGVTDAAGTHLSAPKTWSFTTGSQTKTLTVTIGGNGLGSVQSTPSGIDNCTAGSCVTHFNAGASITLAATAVSNSSLFGDWSGACSNASGNCTLTMDTDKSVTAIFNLFPPVHLDGGNYYSTLQSAYNAGATTCTIKAEAADLTGDFTADLGKDVILEGGYDSGYATNNGYTRVHGIMTIGAGSVTIENINII